MRPAIDSLGAEYLSFRALCARQSVRTINSKMFEPPENLRCDKVKQEREVHIILEDFCSADDQRERAAPPSPHSIIWSAACVSARIMSIREPLAGF
jgi:hypothetical protein